MENNEQNNIEATNNVNPVNNVEPTPVVEAAPEVKTEDTIMVAEPTVRPAVESTPAPVPAIEPTPAPMAQPQEPVAQQPVAPVEPTVTAEPEPVVIPKGEKPKINKKKPNPILIILALILLGGACYFEYIYFVKPIINDASATANNTTEGNTKTNTEEKNESKSQNSNNAAVINDGVSIDNLTITDVTHLVDKYYGSFLKKPNYMPGIFSAELSKELKVRIAIENITLEKFEQIEESVLKGAGFNICIPGSKDAISINEVKEKYKELFNEKMPDISSTGELYSGYNYELYTKDSSIYYVKLDGCGGPYGSYFSKYAVSKYNQKTNDELEVFVNAIYDEEKANDKGDPLGVVACSLNGEYATTCSYKLTFKNVDGNYILVSSEEI